MANLYKLPLSLFYVGGTNSKTLNSKQYSNDKDINSMFDDFPDLGRNILDKAQGEQGECRNILSILLT